MSRQLCRRDTVLTAVLFAGGERRTPQVYRGFIRFSRLTPPPLRAIPKAASRLHWRRFHGRRKCGRPSVFEGAIFRGQNDNMLDPGHSEPIRLGNALPTAPGLRGSAVTLRARSGAIGRMIIALKSKNGTCLNFYFSYSSKRAATPCNVTRLVWLILTFLQNFCGKHLRTAGTVTIASE